VKHYQGKGFRVVYDVVRDADPVDILPVPIRTAQDVVRYFVGLQAQGRIPRERESFAVVALDARHRTIAFQVIATGALNSCPVHPREVFRYAVSIGAHAIVIAHNHPSGDCSPSGEDERITRRLGEAGEVLGIQVLDHVVIAGKRAYSSAGTESFPVFRDDDHRTAADGIGGKGGHR
jgi:DNA repair protein RadC